MKKVINVVAMMLMSTVMLTSCGGSDDASTSNADTSGSADTTAQADAGADTTSDFDLERQISVVSREDGSGTRGAFIELMGIEQKDEDGNTVDMQMV